jgi:hypothetical protein
MQLAIFSDLNAELKMFIITILRIITEKLKYFIYIYITNQNRIFVD